MAEFFTILAVVLLLASTIWHGVLKAWPQTLFAAGLLCWLLSTGVHITT